MNNFPPRAYAAPATAIVPVSTNDPCAVVRSERYAERGAEVWVCSTQPPFEHYFYFEDFGGIGRIPQIGERIFRIRGNNWHLIWLSPIKPVRPSSKGKPLHLRIRDLFFTLCDVRLQHQFMNMPENLHLPCKLNDLINSRRMDRISELIQPMQVTEIIDGLYNLRRYKLSQRVMEMAQRINEQCQSDYQLNPRHEWIQLVDDYNRLVIQYNRMGHRRSYMVFPEDENKAPYYVRNNTEARQLRQRLEAQISHPAPR